MKLLAPIIPRNELAEWSRKAHLAGQKIAFTNGCFDLIHFGHIESFREATESGAKLIVAINSDSSVSKLKGPSRPLMPELDRASLLASLRYVDAVTIFPEPTPLETILLIKPDILVKGDEYADEDIVGASEVRSWGGTIHRVPMRHGRSTSSLINKIKRLS
jgi:rfaE bifunctional protein nucleotidyltransferase chain/domain